MWKRERKLNEQKFWRGRHDRRIIHVDMDAFFAAVEQRDNPKLLGRPVIVGGAPDSRGVVATCSYEARKYGIRSAMASSRAFRLCPDAIFVMPRFDAYMRASEQIKAIFYEYTEFVEPLSLDEAFLDVSHICNTMSEAAGIAEEIRQKIWRRTELTASAGVSFNKFLSKVGSDHNKPNGIKVITMDKAPSFIASLSIRKFFGVGRVTEKRMHSIGIMTGRDLLSWKREDLVKHFGRAGHFYFDIARGIDPRPVCTSLVRRSIGKETTLKEDIDEREEMLEVLEIIAGQLESILKKKNIGGRSISLKVKYHDFQLCTRSISTSEPVFRAHIIMNHVSGMLLRTEAGQRKVRLLGISLSKLERLSAGEKELHQTLLPFDIPAYELSSF